MMKLLFYSLFIFSCQLTFAQKPSFDYVLKEFFQSYNTSDLNPENKIKFHKKRGGWFIAEVKITDETEIFKEQLFWSNKEQKFLHLSFSPAETISTDSVESLISLYFFYPYEKEIQTYQYDRNIYYGYPGWDKDVLDDFGDKHIVNDTLLESLGRAASSYALGFFYDQWGNTITKNDPNRRKLKETDEIDTIRRNEFIRYSKMSINFYKQLLLKNPDYETSVGNIEIKYSNEFLSVYSTLEYAGYPKQAKEFLPKGLYNDSILQIARNYLIDATANSILITTGDNDTYPLWYLQQTEDLRKDVIVLNYNLLGLRRQLYWLYKNYGPSLFGTKPEHFQSSNYDVAYTDINIPCKTPITVKTLLDSINSSHPKQVFGYSNLRSFNCTDLIQDIKVKEAKRIYPSLKDNFTFQFKVQSYYILINDIILFDIFLTNLTRRKIHFTFKEGAGFFTDYVHPTGKVFTVLPLKNRLSPVTD